LILSIAAYPPCRPHDDKAGGHCLDEHRENHPYLAWPDTWQDRDRRHDLREDHPVIALRTLERHHEKVRSIVRWPWIIQALLNRK
jgi:hypothetical protein